mmetsp:Transcript_15733/g.38680  ORF Transcript_15733/g.38680 Transcript_15733/m.38680 type:complete len:236 (+) Transcript_15733:1844-2551(+)
MIVRGGSVLPLLLGGGGSAQLRLCHHRRRLLLHQPLALSGFAGGGRVGGQFLARTVESAPQPGELLFSFGHRGRQPPRALIRLSDAVGRFDGGDGGGAALLLQLRRRSGRGVEGEDLPEIGAQHVQLFFLNYERVLQRAGTLAGQCENLGGFLGGKGRGAPIHLGRLLMPTAAAAASVERGGVAINLRLGGNERGSSFPVAPLFVPHAAALLLGPGALLLELPEFLPHGGHLLLL